MRKRALAPKRSVIKTIIKGLLLALLGLVMLIIAAIAAAYVYYVPEPPDLTAIEHSEPIPSSLFLPGETRVVGEFHRPEKLVLGLDEMPAHLRNAFLACEESDFYSRPPSTLAGSLAGSAALILAERSPGGVIYDYPAISYTVLRASPEGRHPSPAWRRLYGFVALKLESRYSKDEIFHYYLNMIYLGRGAFGVQAAALVYYGKTAHELTLAEAAQLAGLARAPSRGNPFNDVQAARQRRLTVLGRMSHLGLISEAEYLAAENEEPELRPGRAAPLFFLAAPEHLALPNLRGKYILLSRPFILN